MTDDIWTRKEPDSPCVKVCVIHPASGLCLGCLRSAEEIAAWPSMAPETRQHLLDALPARADQIKPKRRRS